MPKKLTVYAIYENPKDFPGMFVLRRHTVTANGSVPDAVPIRVVRTIEEARAGLPRDAVLVGPDPLYDDPVIAEVYV